MVAQVTDERAPFELVPIRWPPAVPTFAFHPGPQNTKPVLLRSTEVAEGEFALEVLSRKFEELVHDDLGHLDSTGERIPLLYWRGQITMPSPGTLSTGDTTRLLSSFFRALTEDSKIELPWRCTQDSTAVGNILEGTRSGRSAILCC